MSIRDEWTSLSPRERDAKVAEAMGWKHVPGSSSPDSPLGGWYNRAGRFMGERRPAFSTSLEHGGGMLERLRDDGWDTRIDIFSGRGDDASAPVDIALRHREHSAVAVRAMTLPEAIALAFCLAKEGDRG
jgi:hypothetical protein